MLSKTAQGGSGCSDRDAEGDEDASPEGVAADRSFECGSERLLTAYRVVVLLSFAGHSSITTTQRYMNARASSLAESMRQARERRVNPSRAR